MKQNLCSFDFFSYSLFIEVAAANLLLRTCSANDTDCTNVGKNSGTKRITSKVHNNSETEENELVLTVPKRVPYHACLSWNR